MLPVRKAIQKGFTLVDLLIVVIILALLAAIVVPQFASSTEDAKLAALDTTLANVRASIDLYKQQHNDYPGAVTAVGATACTGTAGTGTGGAGAQGVQAFIDQLSLYTDVNGGACSTKDDFYKFGPYLKKATLPANPITGVSTLEVVDDGDLRMLGTNTGLGWKYDILVGKFIANDTTDPAGAEPSYDQR